MFQQDGVVEKKGEKGNAVLENGKLNEKVESVSGELNWKAQRIDNLPIGSKIHGWCLIAHIAQ